MALNADLKKEFLINLQQSNIFDLTHFRNRRFNFARIPRTWYIVSVAPSESLNWKYRSDRYHRMASWLRACARGVFSKSTRSGLRKWIVFRAAINLTFDERQKWIAEAGAKRFCASVSFCLPGKLRRCR